MLIDVLNAKVNSSFSMQAASSFHFYLSFVLMCIMHREDDSHYGQSFRLGGPCLIFSKWISSSEWKADTKKHLLFCLVID